MSRPVIVPQSLEKPMPEPKPKPPKKTYTPEFKQNAVSLVTEFKRSYKAAAKQLGCTTQSIRHWVAQHLAKSEPQKHSETVHVTEQLRLAKLENAQLKTQVEILKKATAYFVVESMQSTPGSPKTKTPIQWQ